ncbi:GID complex subunit containing RING finger motif [Tulasnella sp. 403]|nr:GID complex subunit containing RING finger motif [Tulasnella sp. 403]
MDVAKVNHDGALIFEQPFVKVPYEQLRRHFKAGQKQIERDFTILQKESADAAKSKPEPEQARKVLDGMVTRVEGLKRKLEEIQSNNTVPAHTAMRRRLNHLSAFEALSTTDQPGYADWAEIRLDRWLVDWTLRNGKEATAKSIAKSRNIEVREPPSKFPPGRDPT